MRQTLETIPLEATTEEKMAILDRNKLRIKEMLEEYPDDKELAILLDHTNSLRMAIKVFS